MHAPPLFGCLGGSFNDAVISLIRTDKLAAGDMLVADWLNV